MNNILRLWMLAHSFYLSSPLLAETEVSEKTAPAPLEELDILQVITPLLMVIVLIFVLAWLVRKMNRGIPSPGKDIEILSSTPLSNQSRLCLIRVGEKDILIGVTATNISHLETFDEPVAKSQQKENPVEFAKQFRKLLDRKNK